MGANQSHTASGPAAFTSHHPESLAMEAEYPMDQDAVLKQYKVVHRLFPGSGRMMKTFQLQHKSNEATAVIKAMWVDMTAGTTIVTTSTTTSTATTTTGSNTANATKDTASGNTTTSTTTGAGTATSTSTTTPTISTTNTSNANSANPMNRNATPQQILQEQQEELQRIKTALGREPHVAPFSFWLHQTDFVATSASNLLRQHQPIYLLRPHLYTTLSDRLASRPFFLAVEKAWMVHQLLKALQSMHAAKVCHGFLTTENVGLTSWNWLVLMDISSYKARTQLPDDDPSEYLYYFQDHHHHHTTTTITTSSSAGGGMNHPEDSSHPTNAGGGGGDGSSNMGKKMGSRNREKRCYIAPERFVSTTMMGGTAAGVTTTTTTTTTPMTTAFSNYNHLTPAMDIFSAGCVMMELWLNGDRALDLGDLMEYRASRGKLVPQLQQKLNKIESSALRAACKHMVQVDPRERLSAQAYLERLQAAGAVPQVMESCLEPFLQKVSNPKELNIITPDARLALAALYYEQVLWETLGVKDPKGVAYLQRVLGSTKVEMEFGETTTTTTTNDTTTQTNAKAKSEMEQESSIDDLFAETEALLAKLDSLTLLDDNATDNKSKGDSTSETSKSKPQSMTDAITDTSTATEKRTDLCKASLLIYLQLILASIRHVQRPTSKLVALQMLTRLCDLCDSDEIRLQRMVPVSIALLQDQDALVRAAAVKFLSHVVSKVQVFPPSDSKIFPQYIFKRVAPLLTDPSLVVRLAFCQCIAELAETAQRFLDISHAVRLYEAIGGGGGGTGVLSASGSSGSLAMDEGSSTATGQQGSKAKMMTPPTSMGVFTDDVAKLLGDDTSAAAAAAKKESAKAKDEEASSAHSCGGFHGGGNLASSPSGKTLINTNYQEELAALQETVSRWVVHITTDPSEHSSPAKRALLDNNLSRLCNFFGLEGVMAFILPQILAFLNDRKDAQLRMALFCHLPSVCRIVGRAASEHFILPCLESGLVDREQQVVGAAVRCLAELVDLGLLSRTGLLGTLSVSNGPDGTVELKSDGLLRKYSALLVHPSAEIRHGAVAMVNASCLALGSPDSEVYVAHLLLPFLRFQPLLRHLQTPEGMEACLYPSWSRKKFQDELSDFVNSTSQHHPSIPWTSIGETSATPTTKTPQERLPTISIGTRTAVASAAVMEAQVARVREYLRLLGRRIRQPSAPVQDAGGEQSGGSSVLRNSIEGSLKLAQNIKFPRQDSVGVNQRTVPLWFNDLRDRLQSTNATTSDASSIRSVAALGQIYGLSIMAASDGPAEQVSSSGEEKKLSEKEIDELLNSKESIAIEAVCHGEWGSETHLDPVLLDTSLLITKLKALNVPPLPPRLGDLSSANRATAAAPAPAPRSAGGKDTAASVAEWRPKADTLVATSSPITGHTAPVVRVAVSLDQSFFVSGSYDGTCRVWELDQIETSSGVLDSSITYTGHSDGLSQKTARINDLAMVEGSHSVVSAASNGSVHVWRVDVVSQTSQPRAQGYNSDLRGKHSRSRAVGTSEIRQMDPGEGEVLAVSHFNSPSASIITFASQKGCVHSWDLRSSAEPFVLRHGPDIGYLTSMALGTDRNWILTGTSRGFMALWDLRFNRTVKLWHHSRAAPITRLATSFVTPPQLWGSRTADASDVRPFVFASCGPNECAMFDVTSGNCSQCFRTVGYGSHSSHSYAEDIPTLEEVPIATSSTHEMP